MVKQFVNELEKDGSVGSYFAVMKKDLVRPYKNGFMFSLKISDKTGDISLKYWGGDSEEEVKQVFSSFNTQDVIQVNGKVGEYNGKLEIAVNPPDGTISKLDTFDMTNLLKSTTKDIEKMKIEFLDIIENIGDIEIKKLLKSFFDDKTFLQQYATSPAAMSRHHNYVGGLLEHVLSLIELVKKVVEIHPKLSLDLLIAGCVFHDIGKISEYKTGATITYSTEGRLFGHISIGQKMVADRIGKLDSFPEILAQKILHMILSHHGQLDWGSPVKPLFPEAIALHYIDQVDAKIKGVFQDIENANSDDEWSSWTRDYGSLFLK